MKQTPWERAKDLFADALELSEDERGPFLDAQCASDEGLRREVDRLLSAHDAPEGPLADSNPALKSLTRDENESPNAFAPGDVLAGRFRIRRFLGRGGMGEVYEAEDQELGGSVALKTLRPEYGADDRLVARFRREIQIARRVTHPNVCRIFDVGRHSKTDDGGRGGEVAFLTMELLDGETLSDYLKRDGRLSADEALPLIRQMTEGLDALHQAEIVHRDFKPGNVMLIRSETAGVRAVITDFGLARKLSSETGIDTAVSNTGQILGTPDYMAPEQLTGKEVTPATDVYALGLVLYEMLTGEKPFREGEPLEKAVQRVTEKPAAPKAKAPDLPRRWSDVVVACLGKEPEDRPEDVLAVLETLEASGPAPAPLPRRSTGSRRAVRPRRIRLGKNRYAAAAAILLPVLALSGYLTRDRWGKDAAPTDIRTPIHVAVLPFTLVGEGPRLRALADGLMESITSDLSQFESDYGALVVASAREVVRQGISSPSDARALLNTDRAVATSLQAQGDRIRLLLTVVDTETDVQTDSVRVEGSRSRAFELHDRSVAGIANLLGVTTRVDRVDTASPTVPGAHEHYLSGRGYLRRSDQEANVAMAIDQFRRAVAIDSEHAPAHAALAEALWRQYEKQGDEHIAAEALQECEKAMTLDSSSAAVNIGCGVVHSGSGNHDRAIDHYSAATRTSANNGRAMEGMARAHEAAGDIDLAEAIFVEMTRLRSSDWEAYKQLGLFYARNGRYADAIRQFQHVATLVPDNAQAYVNIGSFYYFSGNAEEARKSWLSALEIDPHRTSVHNNLAVLYRDEGENNRAVESLKTALALDPANHQAWGTLGAIYMETERNAEGRAAYGKAVSLLRERLRVTPGSPRYIALLAHHQAALGAETLARRRLAEFRKLDTSDPEDLVAIATAYAHLGDLEAARSYAEQALVEGYDRKAMRKNNMLTEAMKQQLASE